MIPDHHISAISTITFPILIPSEDTCRGLTLFSAAHLSLRKQEHMNLLLLQDAKVPFLFNCPSRRSVFGGHLSFFFFAVITYSGKATNGRTGLFLLPGRGTIVSGKPEQQESEGTGSTASVFKQQSFWLSTPFLCFSQPRTPTPRNDPVQN